MNFPARVFSPFLLWGDALLHLFYPRLCVACQAALPASRLHSFCFKCQSQLEETQFHLQSENEITDRLWGRLQLHSAAAMYYFTKKSPIQWALHQLKYGNQPDIGEHLGRKYGKKLLLSQHFSGISLIIPVPLHPKKERERGYNQSARFAAGLSETMNIPMSEYHLFRKHYTDSQTSKHRMDRFKSVGEVFALKNADSLRDAHVLLVDDVLTTGATLEVCGNLLLGVPGLRLSVVTIAAASLSEWHGSRG